MPYSAPAPCCHPGCGATTTERFCDAHKGHRHKLYDQHRRAHHGERQAFYSTARWKRARAAQLIKEPLCRHCMAQGRVTPAAMADHIIPRVDGGADLDPDNLQSLCLPCHNRKTWTENN